MFLFLLFDTTFHTSRSRTRERSPAKPLSQPTEKSRFPVLSLSHSPLRSLPSLPFQFKIKHKMRWSSNGRWGKCGMNVNSTETNTKRDQNEWEGKQRNELEWSQLARWSGWPPTPTIWSDHSYPIHLSTHSAAARLPFVENDEGIHVKETRDDDVMVKMIMMMVNKRHKKPEWPYNNNNNNDFDH